LLRFDDKQRKLCLSVHDVIDAGPPNGDLQLQVAWSSRSRMKKGQQIHSQYQQEQEASQPTFQSEIHIQHLMVVHGWDIEITGRIDGTRIDEKNLIVEEIKSSTLPGSILKEKDLSDMSAWRRQVELYVYFLQAQGVKARGELVVISIVDDTIHRLSVPTSLTIENYINEQILWLVEEREKQILWLQYRSRSGRKGIAFPHNEWREGQLEMNHQLLDNLANDRVVLLQAPTGYGKTAATLHAAIQMAYQTSRKVFVATARTTQQLMVEDTIEVMAQKGVPIRAISIRAKEKICLNESVSCRPDDCPYAVSYYDKLRTEGLLDTVWGRSEVPGAVWADTLNIVAEDSIVCPYELSMDLSRKADIIVGDYNYLFDPNVQLSWISGQLSDWIVIIDEVHNLPPRARGYGSPELSALRLWQAFLQTKNEPIFSEPIKRALEFVCTGLELLDSAEQSFDLTEGIDANVITELASSIEAVALEYAVRRMTRGTTNNEDDPWLDSARAILRLHSVMSKAGEETVVLWRKVGRDKYNKKGFANRKKLFSSSTIPVKNISTGLQLLCRDPSRFLKPFFEKIGSAICMSATLQPFVFYEQVLGIPQDRLFRLQYSSNFPTENRAAFIIPNVSTTFANREKEKIRIADTISSIIETTPGNVAVFFSSFASMEIVFSHISFGKRPVLKQQTRMSEGDRQEVLSILRRGEGHVMVGVMGGIFSEGIDLPGKALLCAVMVGPALPMANLSRRVIQQWYEEKYGEGFRYGWVVPGMSRVAQAAGRVIRSPEDKGTVVLIGKRFSQRIYRELFPLDWNIQYSKDVKYDLEKFWSYNEMMLPDPNEH
jgi:DNA excision repair protein ERCC-2